MKRFLMSAALMLPMLMALAQTPLQLVIETADGAKHTFEARSLVMSVEGSNLSVSCAAGKSLLDLQQLAGMYFTTDGEAPVSIEGVSAGFVSGAVSVHTVGGVPAGSYGSLAEALGALAPGVYVVSNGSQSLKIQVK